MPNTVSFKLAVVLKKRYILIQKYGFFPYPYYSSKLNMSLLVSFVRFLSDEEMIKLKKMTLSGKEKLLMDSIIQHPEISEVSKKEMLKLLELSSTHYDKISTILLKKAYRHLAGEDDLEQLNFLSKKFMFRHLFHEIRQLSSKVQLNHVADTEKEKYFKALFNFSINVPAKYFDERFVQQSAQHYLSNVKTKRDARELEIKAKMLFARLNKLTQQAPDARATSRIFKEVSELEKKYKNVTDVEPKVVLYHVMVNYYRLVEPNADQRSYYLDKIADLYNGFDNMPSFEKSIAQCHMAEMAYERDDHVKAYQLYREVFSHHLQLLKNQFHHFARYIELAIILNDFSNAQRTLDSLFRVYILNRHESTGVLGALLYAQLYMKTGDLDKAFEYVSIAKSLNSIQVYFHYEIRIRMLETLFFAFTNDYEFVMRLAQRNIRYIQLQKLSLKKYKYAHFFYLLKDVRSLKKIYPGHLPPKLASYLEEFQHGYDLLLGQLLHKLLIMESGT